MVSSRMEDTQTPSLRICSVLDPHSEPHKMSQALGKLSLSGSQGLSMNSHNKGIGVTEVEKTKETPGQPRDKYGWDPRCVWEAGEGQCYGHRGSCGRLVSEN